jgi:hypothetical protein
MRDMDWRTARVPLALREFEFHEEHGCERRDSASDSPGTCGTGARELRAGSQDSNCRERSVGVAQDQLVHAQERTTQR